MTTKQRVWWYVRITALILVCYIIGTFVWWMMKIALILLLGFFAYLIVRWYVWYLQRYTHKHFPEKRNDDDVKKLKNK